MEIFRTTFIILLVLILWSCKKEAQLTSNDIAVQDLYVTSVQGQRVDIVYKLSQLGYKETGVVFYPRDKPDEQRKVVAIRKDEQFNLSLMHLEPMKEYGFKVYYQTEGGEQIIEKEHIVKTLSATSLKFKLEIGSSELIIKDGKYQILLEGDFLNELNLSALNIYVNDEPATVNYPIRIAGQRYSMLISGKAMSDVSGHLITAFYKEDEIFSHYIPVKTGKDNYTIRGKAVNLLPGWYSVYKNDLYSFIDEKVLRWDETNHRMVTLRAFKEGYVWGNKPCFEFDNQMFFPPQTRAKYTDPEDPNKFDRFLEVVSYSPESNSFNGYTVDEPKYPQKDLSVENSQFFVHKSEMYMAFTLVDLSGQFANQPIIRTNFVYKYNKSRKQFQYVSGLKTDILSYHFTSINNQMYLVGLVPVTDQGFQLSATFGAYKVSDTFVLESIFTAGTLTKPLKFAVKGIATVDGNILIVSSMDDYKIFDPLKRTLHQVGTDGVLSGQYFNGLFTYKNILHINADAGFTNQRIYELSVKKGN
jgi:hypothetical protein